MPFPGIIKYNSSGTEWGRCRKKPRAKFYAERQYELKYSTISFSSEMGEPCGGGAEIIGGQKGCRIPEEHGPTKLSKQLLTWALKA